MKKLIITGGILQTVFSALGMVVLGLLALFVATCAAVVSGVASGISGSENGGEVNLGAFGAVSGFAALIMFLLFICGILTAIMAGKNKIVKPFIIVQMVFDFLIAALCVFVLVRSTNVTGVITAIVFVLVYLTPFVLYLVGLIRQAKESKAQIE